MLFALESFLIICVPAYVLRAVFVVVGIAPFRPAFRQKLAEKQHEECEEVEHPGCIVVGGDVKFAI